MVMQNATIEQEKSPDELTSKQLQAALLLAEGNTALAIADKLGVSRASIQRWKRVPAFQQAIRDIEQEVFLESMNLLKRSARAAIMTLIACMDPKVSHYVRVQAASKLLDQAIELAVSREIEARLDALEQLAKEA